MSKMTRLNDFPPSLLSRITRLLQFEDLLRVMMLTGDKAFLHRCTNLGGVLELVATTERSINLLARRLSQLPPFSHLTHVKIGCDKRVPSQLDLLAWHLALPQTLRSLEVSRSDLAPGLLLRPLQDNDDVFTVSHCSTNGFTTESMKDRFPNLHTLIIPLRYWQPYPLQERFIKDLPDTITCLDVGHANMFVAPPLIYALYKYDSQDCLATALAHFTQCRITKDNMSSYMKDANGEELSKLVAPLMRLTSLSILPFNEHESNDLIQYLTNLQDLSLDFLQRARSAKIMPLPPFLTKLSCTLFYAEELTQLFEHVPFLPNLTTLEVKQVVSNRFGGSIMLPALPRKLRKLRIQWSVTLPDDGFCPFPASLTHLELDQPSFDLAANLRHLPNLRTLIIPNYALPLEALPRSLTKLDCSFCCDLSEFAHLPSSIRELTGLKLNLTREAYEELTASTPLRGWSHAAFFELLRLRFPHLKDMPDIAVRILPDCLTWIGAKVSEKTPPWTFVDTSWYLPEPAPPSGKFVIPSSVTRINKPFEPVPDLPRDLLYLHAGLDVESLTPDFNIATPRLQTLEATIGAIPPLNWESVLPKSLTSLMLSGYPFSYREIDVSSLLSLKRLSIQRCVLDLGKLQPILPNLEYLSGYIIIRPGVWTAEALQTLFKTGTVSSDRQWYQCCLSLLPPQLRDSPQLKFLLDWKPSAAALLPRDMRSFALPFRFQEHQYPTTVGLLPEPHSWTKMATSALSSLLPTWFPPPSFSELLPRAALTRLAVHDHFLSAQDYASLPHSLLYLSLKFATIAVFYSTPPSKLPGPGLDKARIMSLPPRLTSLSLQGGHIDLSSFHLMPTSLISLTLRLSASMSPNCPWELLPTSLRILQADWLYLNRSPHIFVESEKIRKHLPLLEKLLGLNSGDIFKLVAHNTELDTDYEYLPSVWATHAQSIANA